MSITFRLPETVQGVGVDVNAARNMAFLARQSLAGVERPRLFSVSLSARRDNGTEGVQIPVQIEGRSGGP